MSNWGATALASSLATDTLLPGWTKYEVGPRAGSASAVLTWLFEEDSFAPLAKLSAQGAQSVMCDHLGTPLTLHNAQGTVTWELTLDSYVERNWLFIHHIEAQYLNGFYTPGTVGFDPASDPFPGMDDHDWTASYQDKPAALAIQAPLLEAESEEGITLHTVEQLNALREPDPDEEA